MFVRLFVCCSNIWKKGAQPLLRLILFYDTFKLPETLLSFKTNGLKTMAIVVRNWSKQINFGVYIILGLCVFDNDWTYSLWKRKQEYDITEDNFIVRPEAAAEKKINRT